MDDLFEYVVVRNTKEKLFLRSIVNMYNYNNNKLNLIVRGVVHFFSLFLKPENGLIKYFFWGTKYQELILGLPKGEVCIIGGPKQLHFCLKYRINFFPVVNLWGLLSDRLNKKDLNQIDNRLFFFINLISNKIKKIGFLESNLIVDNDSLPMQRTIIKAFKKANIGRVICIQHGIFQSKSDSCIVDGWYSDLFFSVDEQNRKILIDKGLAAHKVGIMGFHSSPYIPTRIMSVPSHRKICLLGQPWGKYSKELEILYLKIFQNIIQKLSEAGYSFVFKPHPWERDCKYLRSMPCVLDISMNKAIERYDVFISLTSTALFEAYYSGRLAIQILDPAFNADDFSKISDMVSLKYNELNLNKINELIQGNKRENNSFFIKKPHERFIDALNSY